MKKNEIIIKLIKVHIDIKKSFDSLLTICQDVVSFREQKLEYLNEKLDISPEDLLNDDKFTEFFKLNSDDLKSQGVYLFEFNYLFYNSIFINLFSLFEIQFVKLGKICEELSESDLKIKDLKGTSDIDTIRKYMNLVCKLDSAKSSEKLWADIEEFRNIRNAIVHNENQLNKTKTKNLNSIRGMRKLKQHKIEYFQEEVSFKINNVEFLKDFTTTSEEYLGVLIKEIFK
ncbi:hypothetical protein [Flavobacterium soyangense]|uniref:Uncharacterized protein n=1 Tax=Flavobacterium soyangense TaxID=2023265 RepID=A0A930XZL5_9FLAO|nr:hypothetical protein [Flavobacterium soyangense]MBF2709023.1 hypothetical protein [Flavobacterium soyangense]